MSCNIITFVIVVAFAVVPLQIDAICNSCGTNSIACFNETSFYMCYGTDPDTSNPITCPEGKICSHSQLRCVEPSSSILPECSPNKECGICDGSKMFTCTSRTTFAMCNGDQLIDIQGVCPPRLACDSSNIEVCVDKCKLPAVLECDRVTPL